MTTENLLEDGHSGALVALAPRRADRPGARRDHDAIAVRWRQPLAACPFCPGKEAQTPPASVAIPDGHGWHVRAFENRYPALAAQIGAQDVVVHGREHVLRLAECPVSLLPLVGEAWASRIRAHRAAGRPWVVPLVNEGAASGSSLDHSHSQVIATRAVPPRLALETARAADGRDVLDDADDDLVVHEDDDLVVFCPRASRSSFELRVARRGDARDPADEPELAGRAIGLAVHLLDRVVGPIALSAWLHHAPPGGGPLRWHVEALPRLGVLGGMELGVGILICQTPPADAAAAFRAHAGAVAALVDAGTA